MKVSELIERLKLLDGERLVVLSRDEEGNGFSELSDVETCVYDDGEIGLEKLTPELIDMGYSDEDIIEGTLAVCLWP